MTILNYTERICPDDDPQVQRLHAWAEANYLTGSPPAKKPDVLLPGGRITISECAAKLFGIISPTHKMFHRGGAVACLLTRDDGSLTLDVLSAPAARSYFEDFVQFQVVCAGRSGEMETKPSICSEATAKALLHSKEASCLLPRVRGLINCPILREANGELSVAGPGYDLVTRRFITGGETPPAVPLKVAVHELIELLDDFDFQTAGDKSRACASLLTPALRMGNFLKGRVPVDVAEADQSQSGKTYRHKIIAALYNERISLVTSRTGGVGSTDESFDQKLIAGRPFVQHDNFRGRFDSPHLEAFLTSEGSFPCRVPRRPEINVEPENFFIMLSSNGMETTRDFANRSNIIRVRKKPPGFEFRKYPEGDLLAHVRQQQAFYLGCVFAVLREWHACGCQRTNETRHDFREWVQIVDWIVRNLFHAAPVMDGHGEIQERVSNPAQTWMRAVVLAVVDNGDMGRSFTATDLYEVCDNAGISIPGIHSATDECKSRKVIGALFSRLFGEQNQLKVDGYVLTRQEKYFPRDDGTGTYKSKTYTVTRS